MDLNIEQRIALLRAQHDANKLSHAQERSKKEIDPKIYAARHAEQMKRDATLAAQKKSDIINKNIEIWQNSIDPLWKHADIESADFRPHVRASIEQAVSRWVNPQSAKRQVSLLFQGEIGRGKTWAAYAYAFELIKRGILNPNQIQVVNETTLAAISKSGYELPKQMASLLNPQAQLFVFDDVGRGAYKDPNSQGSIWFEILDHAYSANRGVVITTNMVLGNLSAWITSAGYDRFKHMCGPNGLITISDDIDMRARQAQSH